MRLKKMDEQIYFKPGDCVTLRQREVMQCPVMLVMRKEQQILGSKMTGIRCRWFTASNTLQEAVFNTKDLIKVE